jgi:ABC-type nitrate/sulfonate/bicarbonate transport system permease component
MRAILMATVIEALAAFQGIGKMLWLSGEWLRVDAYLAYLFVLATLGLGAVATLKLAAQSLAPWINEMPEPARKFDA